MQSRFFSDLPESEARLSALVLDSEALEQLTQTLESLFAPLDAIHGDRELHRFLAATLHRLLNSNTVQEMISQLDKAAFLLVCDYSVYKQIRLLCMLLNGSDDERKLILKTLGMHYPIANMDILITLIRDLIQLRYQRIENANHQIALYVAEEKNALENKGWRVQLDEDNDKKIVSADMKSMLQKAERMSSPLRPRVKTSLFDKIAKVLTQVDHYYEHRNFTFSQLFYFYLRYLKSSETVEKSAVVAYLSEIIKAHPENIGQGQLDLRTPEAAWLYLAVLWQANIPHAHQMVVRIANNANNPLSAIAKQVYESPIVDLLGTPVNSPAKQDRSALSFFATGDERYILHLLNNAITLPPVLSVVQSKELLRAFANNLPQTLMIRANQFNLYNLSKSHPRIRDIALRRAKELPPEMGNRISDLIETGVNNPMEEIHQYQFSNCTCRHHTVSQKIYSQEENQIIESELYNITHKTWSSTWNISNKTNITYTCEWPMDSEPTSAEKENAFQAAKAMSSYLGSKSIGAIAVKTNPVTKNFVILITHVNLAKLYVVEPMPKPINERQEVLNLAK